MPTFGSSRAVSLSITTVSRVRVFLASPGDVEDERDLARAVVDKLRNEFRYRDLVKFEIIAWDQPGVAIAQEAILTPQAAIARGLPKPSECDLVVVMFWSRMGTPLPTDYTKPDGNRYLSGTEWELVNAMEAAKEHGHPTVWLYRRTQDPNLSSDDPPCEQKKTQWNRVKYFFEAFSDADGAILGGINTYEEPAEFGTLLEDYLRGWIDRRLAVRKSQEPHSLASKESRIEWQGNPYPGLRAFIPDEASIFFGRRLETNTLLDMLAAPEGKFVAVVGASGSGKSSLVAAGLLPALKANAIAGSDQWLSIRFKPAEIDDNPFRALAVQLAPLLEKYGWRAGDLANQLYEMPTLLTESLTAQLCSVSSGTGDLLLVIDQFEEVFTHCASTYLGQFIDLVASAVSATQVRIVITMRADYYQNCVEWPELTMLLNKGAYSLPVPGVAALLDMIQGPARLAGLVIEDGLSDRMLKDLGEEPGRLALVAFSLEKLYESGKAERRLTHKAYQGFGGVRGAVAQKADETYISLQRQGVDVETALGQVFRELASIDPKRNVATRKRAPLSTFANDALQLVNALTDARLLVSDKGAVEVAHEVLFGSWPRLKDWIDTVGDDLRLHDKVRFEALAWANAGHDPNQLWAHEQLVPVNESFFRLGLSRYELDEPLKSFLCPEAERLLKELEKDESDHDRRSEIGDRLNQIGDPRRGVGVDEKGVPLIEWLSVPAGGVVLEDNAGSPQAVVSFHIAKYLVTYHQYRSFLVAENGYKKKRWWTDLKREEAPGKQYRPMGNHPADTVSWYDAMAFCRWLSTKLGFEVGLPTEYQWQQASIGENPDNVYPWGPDWDDRMCNTRESRLSHTTAVGMYPRSKPGGNPEGALDMAGNVWEWCLNKYSNPHDCSPSGEEPRVMRGGSWLGGQVVARTAYRSRGFPDSRLDYFGFRLCCKSPVI